MDINDVLEHPNVVIAFRKKAIRKSGRIEVCHAEERSISVTMGADLFTSIQHDELPTPKSAEVKYLAFIPF